MDSCTYSTKESDKMILINFLYQDIPSVGKADHFCAAPHFPDLWTIWIKYAHNCQPCAGLGFIYAHTFGQGGQNLKPRGDDDEDESVDRDVNNSNSAS